MRLKIFLLCGLSLVSYAEELALEDDFSKKGEISFGMGFNYIHSKSDGIKNTNYVLQTSSGDFVEVPVSSSATTSSDIVSSTISGSYGVSSDMTAFLYV